MNKTIKHSLKTKLKNLKGRWEDHLSEVLWAYRTTAKSTTGEMLFSLGYGYEVMVSFELSAGSLRKDNFDVEKKMILYRRELDFLQEKWCNLQLPVTTYIRRIVQYFNSKVNTRRFQERDIILRRVLHNKGALDLSWEGPYKIARVLALGAYKLAHLNGD